MRVFKTTYRDRKGKTREASKWYCEWTDHLNTVRRLPGFTSKAATEELGRNLERLTGYAKATGGQTDPKLADWLRGLSAGHKTSLVRIGLLAPERAALAKPLSGHVDDFEAMLKSRASSAVHVQVVTGRVRAIVDGCGFTHVGDVSGSKVIGFIESLRADKLDGKGGIVKRGIGAQTSTFYIGALKQFFRWMVKDRRAAENPVAHLERWNVRTDRRHDRRPLSPQDVRKLLRAAEGGGVVFGVPGPARAMFYRLAVETGLRSGELRSLTRASLHLGDAPTVTVKAAYAKNRREDTLPLRPETAAVLNTFLGTLAPAAPLFKLPHPSTMIDMLRADLKTAGIPYELDGKYADLHALRHTCGSWLAAAGVHPKVIQRVLRHSTITLTMDKYTHAFKGDEAAAIAKLPDLTAQPEAAQATGTGGPTVLADCLALLGGPEASGVGARGRLGGGRVQPGILKNAGKVARFADETRIHPRGFEPLTLGSEDRCSIR